MTTASTPVRAELLVEPFVEGAPGTHVLAAVAALRQEGLAPDIGPFATTVAGPAAQVTRGIEVAVRAAMDAGATRVSIQVAAGGTDLRGEDLNGALDRMVADVERELGAPLDELSREDKQAAVRLLNERGAFLLRRSVEDVASRMGVSRITIYNYLHAIEDPLP